MNITIPSYWTEIPEELIGQAKWAPFRAEYGVWDSEPVKIPYDLNTGKPASVTDPSTWSSFQLALLAYRSGFYDGVGYVFTADDPYTGIDLDDCFDPETIEVADWAQDLIDRFDTYTEWSPSGRGFHMLIKAKLPGRGRRKGLIEMHDDRQFFTVTGEGYGGTPKVIADRSEELSRFYQELFGGDTGQTNSDPGAA